MAYIGNQPTEAFTTFATQTFSTSATSSYTLDHAVTNENEIALFVNNVRQQPGSGKAYTATGTALTLSANTASTDTMYCVFLGRALQTVNPPAGSVGSSQIAAEMITGTTALAATPDDTDELLISDAGTLKRIDFSHIKGGGAFELITTTTLSSAASSVDFTSTHITTTYRDYRIIASGLIGSADDVKFALMFSTGGDGSSYRTDSDHDYAFSNINSDDNNHQYETDVNQGLVYISGAATQGNATGESGSFIADIFDPLNQTSDNSMLHGIASGVYRGQDGVLLHFRGGFGIGGSGTEDTSFNGIRVKYSSGNIAQGTVSLYGRKI